MEMLLFKTVIVISAIMCAIAIRYAIPSLKDDNPIEEVMEDLIHKEIGVNIDLSPASQEKEK